MESGTAQTIDVGPADTSICDGQPITLFATTTGVTSNPVMTAIDLAEDDEHSQLLNIGFSFEFFGNSYSQCVASSNGYVTFDLTQEAIYSPWNIDNPSPQPGVPDNAIMFPWQDINPRPDVSPNGQTNAVDCGDGTFVVDYVDIAMFSCTDTNFTMQVVLYEGSNIIDTYISEKPLCATWNDGAAIHGLENANGTQSVIVPGRNYPSQWTATNDAVRFIPDGIGGYTIDQSIPFNPILVGTEELVWTDELGNTLGTSASITVTPVAPTWYYCTYKSACSAILVTDSILVTFGNVAANAEATDASCFGYDDGYIVVDPSGSNYPVSIDLLDTNGVMVSQASGVFGIDTLDQLFAGVYDISVTDQVGCEAVLQIELSEPEELRITADHTDVLCNGDSNGSAWAEASGSVGPYSYQWDDPLQQTTDSIEFLAPGTYAVLTTDAQNCFKDTTVVIAEPLPLMLELTSGIDTCLYGNGAVEAVSMGGTPPYTYNWTGLAGDSSKFSIDTVIGAWSLISQLSAGEYSVEVEDTNNCVTSGSIEVGLIHPPNSGFSTRSKPIEFTNPSVQFVNESSAALTYQWNFGDGSISFEENPEHTYDTAGIFLVMQVVYNEPRYGCSDTSFQYVEVDPLFTFYVPSAFTPDGDGLNDTWGPIGQNFEYESYNVKIYDRWGKLIWQTDNPSYKWDGMFENGKEVKQGMYVYVFTLKEFNTFEPKVTKGTVTLYRHN